MRNCWLCKPPLCGPQNPHRRRRRCPTCPAASGKNSGVWAGPCIISGPRPSTTPQVFGSLASTHARPSRPIRAHFQTATGPRGHTLSRSAQGPNCTLLGPCSPKNLCFNDDSAIPKQAERKPQSEETAGKHMPLGPNSEKPIAALRTAGAARSAAPPM
eukprot:11831425-Alexandrium_andersonii.AAC.1